MPFSCTFAGALHSNADMHVLDGALTIGSRYMTDGGTNMYGSDLYPFGTNIVPTRQNIDVNCRVVFRS